MSSFCLIWVLSKELCVFWKHIKWVENEDKSSAGLTPISTHTNLTSLALYALLKFFHNQQISKPQKPQPLPLTEIMVQIANTLIIAAAVVVPVLSAPFGTDSNSLETREPKGIRTAANIVGKVAGGVSLGATVGGLMHQRDLESREPRITGSQIAAAGRIAHNVKSGVEFGAAVAPIFPHKSRREFNELDARRISGATLRTIGGGVAGAAGFAGTVAAMNTRPQRRGLENSESLEARRVSGATIRKVGSGLAGAAGFAGTVAAMNTRPQRRDLENSQSHEARRVSGATIRKVGSGLAEAAGFAGTVAALNTRPQQRREIVDFETREPRFPGFLKKAVGLVLRDDNGDMYVREVDGAELDARDPKFFGFLKKAAGLVLRETPEFDSLD
ncbi:hypothetical protein M413DRAFT_27564 [Hebeloma cylindrosporum]|uniref:Uncharacterized protein n=1 Tax=Hebeloma cylindrosporum TaxID=76867 RepID=A0A0C2YM00_HEBCY|nr:hypothetical protein M413DRAFT_27564 [Hebeloma cylindrosporum h7]